MKKIIVFTLAAITLITMIGFSISNYIRPLSNPTIADIDIICFDHQLTLSALEREKLKSEVEEIAGVKSVQINDRNMVVSIDAEISNRNDLELEIKRDVNAGFSLRQYAESDKPQCPVTGADSYPQKIAQIFRF